MPESDYNLIGKTIVDLAARIQLSARKKINPPQRKRSMKIGGGHARLT
jgi:hypothetical protein